MSPPPNFFNSSMQGIHHLIESHADTHPNSIALIHNHQAWEYQQLNAKANQLAHYLIEKGIGPEVLVGVILNRSFSMIISILAILKSGGAYVPIDPNYPLHRIEYILTDSSVYLLLTQKSLVPRIPQTTAEKIVLDDEEAIWAIYPHMNPTLAIIPNHLAYLLYTSGSTGNPKGVMVTHDNLIATFLSWQLIYQLTSNDRHLQMASFSFDVFSGDLIRALCSGATLVLCPTSSLLKPRKLYNLMQTYAVNCAEFVPPILRRLVEYVRTHHQSLDFIRLLLCGSDSWTLGEYRTLKNFCGKKTRIINSYGLTEASIDSTWFEENTKTPLSLADNQPVPLGRPFPHVTVFLFDEQLSEVKPGKIGEIYIGGAGVARGYYKRPELNKERFITLLQPNGTKLYKTGDQGCFLPDGTILFLGRIDNQVKLRGIRIEVSEIEYAITCFPPIKECIVLLTEWEQNHPRLVAFIVTELNISIKVTNVRHFLAKKLPNYLIPHTFIRLNKLPLTPNGKIDRNALKQFQ